MPSARLSSSKCLTIKKHKFKPGMRYLPSKKKCRMPCKSSQRRSNKSPYKCYTPKPRCKTGYHNTKKSGCRRNSK